VTVNVEPPRICSAPPSAIVTLLPLTVTYTRIWQALAPIAQSNANLSPQDVQFAAIRSTRTSTRGRRFLYTYVLLQHHTRKRKAKCNAGAPARTSAHPAHESSTPPSVVVTR
jgi:hypothetical protein